ncbi:MAG: aminoacetone oxidase family FAD-binding enzyme [Candidatus Cloacimonadota bacterium]|nr:MAG: aminoacetone oxidase family FAD-binding enzyme [Candidatus Cloacimonadota bacterium]PIE77445.1 MAG: aminoacetone oxidase family FAD-binding enzyme [Candidatus Delongbacteria bacterium]
MDIAVIGGGAAGFFTAINIKENYPNYSVTIFDKSQNLLSKVKISGGGRCNLTNGAKSISELSKGYPRGEKRLKKIFSKFSNFDCINWFENRGVPLVLQDDNCVFPKSQDSSAIIDCFLSESKRLGIKVIKSADIHFIKSGDKLSLAYKDRVKTFDSIVVATGGSPKKEGLLWLENLGHKIEDPVPSLFTFSIPNSKITSLMGIVIENSIVSIEGTKLKSAGTLLITHWGVSGPAILKLSSFGARVLNEKNYRFNLKINWIGVVSSESVVSDLNGIKDSHKMKYLSNYRPYNLTERVWSYLLEKLALSMDKRWGEIGKRDINRLSNILTNDIYEVRGKTSFKEEFVTCGGVSLESVDIKTMESKIVKNLYFAGEILDIDGITGGYNLQAAWSTGFVAAKLGLS